MSEQIARDPFYDMKPEKFWIGITNATGDGKLHVIAEINGVRKEIWAMKPSYAEPDEGVISDWTNFTWAIQANQTQEIK